MVAKLRLVFSISIVLCTFSGAAQQDYWKPVAPKASVNQKNLERWHVNRGSTFSLDEDRFLTAINAVSKRARAKQIVHFPYSDGQIVAFEVEEASILSEALSKKYPNIRSFKGKALNDKALTVRFSTSHKGIQATIVGLNATSGSQFIQKNQDGTYIRYTRKDRTKTEKAFICKTDARALATEPNLTARVVDDQNLRTYRVAISASGEYTQYHGGTKADALAAINNTLTRINAVFERDLAVTLELIGNTDAVIYTNAATDPYNGNLSSQVQNTLSSVIGEANYDIGHLFNREEDVLDGNAGFIASVCKNNQKGSAYSTLGNPEGDFYDIDLVAHEMGHQLGANHTFSYTPEGTNAQVEPGSGTTIMAYAGITNNNDVAPNSDDYFHYVSIVQIWEYLQTTTCGTSAPILNSPPTVAALADYSIPRSTPFVLTASASDPDPADVLTFTWEQIDPGIVTQATFGPDNFSGAMFRSLPPSTVPNRYFPALDRVLAGTLEQTAPQEGDAWETVSNVGRDLNFAVTVRDNALNGGQSASEETRVAVIEDAGPFVVTSQSTSQVYSAGDVMTVTWDVANTYMAPISAQQVDILLSLDGGQTFDLPLAQNIQNDGNHDVLLPGAPSTTARIMVKPSSNIFYAVNAQDFTILESPVVLHFSSVAYEVCTTDDLAIDFDYETYAGYAEESTLSVESAPPGLTLTFSQDTVSVDTPLTLTLTDVANLTPGSYTINVTATSASITKQVPLVLTVYDGSFTDVALLSPANGLTDVSLALALEWQGDARYTGYDLEIATDVGFANIIETASMSITTYEPSQLGDAAQYFWRVRPKNTCGEGPYGPAWSFTTISVDCKIRESNELPLNITATGTPTVTTKIPFFQDLPVSDVNVSLELDHTYLSDLTIRLTSPAGTTVILVSNACGELRNINAVFDDDAQPYECSGTPAISGTVKPQGSLAAFYGESILGEWILEVKDNAPADGGTLKAFGLEMCIEGAYRPDADNDGVFDDGEDLCLGTPEGQEVDASGCAVYRFANDHFTVLLESESCRGNNDGELRVVPKSVLDYEVTVNGTGTNEQRAFTDNYSLTGLGAGTYTVCITGTDGAITYEPYCLDVVIAQPDPLSVGFRVNTDEQSVALDLSGAGEYIVELNGELSIISENQVTLGLNKGLNFLKVATNKACQGVYEQKIIVPSGNPEVFPNPVWGSTALYFDELDATVQVSIFSADGRLLQSRPHNAGQNVLDLDFTAFPAGIYYVRVEGRTTMATTKIIKQ